MQPSKLFKITTAKSEWAKNISQQHKSGIKSKIVSVVTNGQSAEGGGQMVRGRGLQEDERRHGGYLAVHMVDMVDCRYFWVSWYLIQKWIYCTSDILLSWRQEAEGAGVSDFLLARPRLGWGTLSQPLEAVLSAQTYFHMMAFWLLTLHYSVSLLTLFYNNVCFGHNFNWLPV